MSNSLAIIPARGGSKRIHRKNIRHFFGKPIISYPILTAIKSRIFNEVMVSTEDEEIADIAKEYGAKVPFLRSLTASEDHVTTAAVINECLSEYAKLGKKYEYICCIYPTAVFTTETMLGYAHSKLIDGADAIVTVTPSTSSTKPTLDIVDGYIRTDFSEARFSDAGQFYFFKTNTFTSRKTMTGTRAIPIILPANRVIDINTKEDWELAERLFKKAVL